MSNDFPETVEEARVVELQPEWTEWWYHQLRILTHEGVIAVPMRGIIYQVNKRDNTVSIVAMLRGANLSPEYVVDTRCMEQAGYKVQPPSPDVTCDLEQYVAKVNEIRERAGTLLLDANTLDNLAALVERFQQYIVTDEGHHRPFSVN